MSTDSIDKATPGAVEQLRAAKASEVAAIRKSWGQLLDKFNEGKISEIGVALWASMHVDRLIALAQEADHGN